MGLINWIQDWLQSQCDLNWENYNSIKIESIDNPGWNIEIDLCGTTLANKVIERKLFEFSPTNWVGYKIDNAIFSASGDTQKLDFLISIFKELVEKGNVDDKYILKNMNCSESK